MPRASHRRTLGTVTVFPITRAQPSMARCVALAVLFLLSPWIAHAASVDLLVREIPLNPEDTAQAVVDRLQFRGGLEISSSESGFGGFSALAVGADGTRLIALSDSGGWLRARIVHDAEGRLVDLRDGELGALIDTEGRVLNRKRWSDAESVAETPDGDLVVAFEREHRLWRYPRAEPPFSLPPEPAIAPADLGLAPANGGIEALTALKDGRLLAVSEDMADGDAHLAAWIGGERGWTRRAYARQGRFKPTGAATLPSGDVLVLERRYTVPGGPAARVVRLSAGLLDDPAAPLQGTEVALIEPPLTLDNFEGIAVRQGAGGETLLYLLSDDNFSPTQRTLLLLFALRETD